MLAFLDELTHASGLSSPVPVAGKRWNIHGGINQKIYQGLTVDFPLYVVILGNY